MGIEALLCVLGAQLHLAAWQQLYRGKPLCKSVHCQKDVLCHVSRTGKARCSQVVGEDTVHWRPATTVYQIEGEPIKGRCLLDGAARSLVGYRRSERACEIGEKPVSPSNMSSAEQFERERPV